MGKIFPLFIWLLSRGEGINILTYIAPHITYIAPLCSDNKNNECRKHISEEMWQTMTCISYDTRLLNCAIEPSHTANLFYHQFVSYFLAKHVIRGVCEYASAYSIDVWCITRDSLCQQMLLVPFCKRWGWIIRICIKKRYGI